MSGFSRPAAAKMSTTPSAATARETICRMAWSSSSSVSRLARRALHERRLHRLEEGDVVADAQRLSCGTASANACDSSATARTSRVLAVRPARGCAPAPPGAAPSRSCGDAGRPTRDQSKPWKRSQQTSCFSSITATASSWSRAVSPVPPLSV